jgi:lactoylglutathione lyase
MGSEGNAGPNLLKTVPFLAVSDIVASLRYYVDGLGFEVAHEWVDQGTLRWCWLQRGGAAVMLQQFPTEGHDGWRPQGKVGEGVALYFICDDALAVYRQVVARGLPASVPFVGNGMWVFGLRDPDGYQLYFESATDAPECTSYRDTRTP